MKRSAEISRRQLLTGALRGRDTAASKTGPISAPPRDFAREELGERHGPGRGEAPQIGRDCTAPETAPRIPDWGDGMKRALEEMENLKGIEGF